MEENWKIQIHKSVVYNSHATRCSRRCGKKATAMNERVGIGSEGGFYS